MLQAYSQVVREDGATLSILTDSLMPALLQIYESVGDEMKEVAVELMMVMAHLSADARMLEVTCRTLGSMRVEQYRVRHVVKMVPVLFMDYMMTNPDQH